MKHVLAALALAACAVAPPLRAQAPDPAPGQMLSTETRPGVQVPYFAAWRDDAVATLVLFSGGPGGFGRVQPGSPWPRSNNFLIRSAPLFARHPFNVVLMGRASDTRDLDWAARTSAAHLADNLAVLRAVKQRSSAPIWLVGTSRGTVSITAAAINDSEHLVSGLVLTSSIVNPRVPGSVPTQDLAKVQVPTLVVHHEHDQCRICSPAGVDAILRGLTAAPVKTRRWFTGGEDQATGDPCEALHTHGYVGIEQQVVDFIAGWVAKPTS